MATPFTESQCPIQPRSRRLKDFLQDQNLPFPRSHKSTISVFLHAAIKSSSILRRSFSRRFCNKNRSTLPEPATMSVTVKDILRWRSFNVPPLPESPRCTSTTTTTTSAGTPRSSWCDSDFTVDDSPVGFRGDADFKINVAAGERNTRDPKDRIILVEEEQFSPISVLDFAQEHEQTFSPFHQILADIKRRNIMLKQRIQDFESLIKVDDIELNDVESYQIEEQVIELFDHVKTTSSIGEWDLSLDCLLLDFFWDELMTSKEVENNGKLESRVLSVAKSWVRGKDDGCLQRGIEGTREVCFREMEKRWESKDFKDDQKEIVIKIEKIMLNSLLDELLVDLVSI